MLVRFWIAIVSLTFLAISCNSVWERKIDKEGIMLESSYTQISDSVIKFDVSLINGSTHPFAIIYKDIIFKNVTRPSPFLFLDIKLGDSINVEGGDEILFKLRAPTKDDYKIVNVGEQLALSFTINFNNLLMRNNSFKGIKVPKGKYSFQVFYSDNWMKHPFALDSLRSNKLFFEWK